MDISVPRLPQVSGAMAVSLVVESTIWYVISVLVILARLVSRRLILGSFKKFQADDVLMLVALATDTSFMVAMNFLVHYNTNLIDPAHPVVLTPQEVHDRALGSKLVLVVEQSQIATTWLVKTCLLFMYSRLTFSKVQKICVKVVAGYVAFGFVLMECSTALNHLITNAVLNISSDLFIIMIPMPVFLQIQIPTKKKIILCAVFAVGFFTIGAAVANKYYSFREPYGSKWTNWYIRESSTALIVSNIPFLWTSVRYVLRLSTVQGAPASRPEEPAALAGSYGHNAKNFKHSTIISRGSHGAELAARFEPLGSQENIQYYNEIPLKIYKRQEVHVFSETPEAESSQMSQPRKDSVSCQV
ncbi:hypothetical protein F4802DRAFT_593566 [Xylaria palmicola]|nr:hypothetical protein F4802DRAFT_593566 [Xylaria palmicola]